MYTQEKFSQQHDLFHAVGLDATIGRIQAHRTVNTQAVLTALATIPCATLEAQGIFVNWEWRADGDATTALVFAYIGLVGVGIVAQYNARQDDWHECQSHGNFGGNPASGGTWSGKGVSKTPPAIVQKLVKALKF